MYSWKVLPFLNDSVSARCCILFSDWSSPYQQFVGPINGNLFFCNLILTFVKSVLSCPFFLLSCLLLINCTICRSSLIKQEGQKSLFINVKISDLNYLRSYLLTRLLLSRDPFNSLKMGLNLRRLVQWNNITGLTPM